jgi:hypothetical protein
MYCQGPVDMLSTVTLDGFLRNINKLTLHPVKKASIRARLAPSHAALIRLSSRIAQGPTIA